MPVFDHISGSREGIKSGSLLQLTVPAGVHSTSSGVNNILYFNLYVIIMTIVGRANVHWHGMRPSATVAAAACS
jgi:hypothetical protein